MKRWQPIYRCRACTCIVVSREIVEAETGRDAIRQYAEHCIAHACLSDIDGAPAQLGVGDFAGVREVQP